MDYADFVEKKGLITKHFFEDGVRVLTVEDVLEAFSLICAEDKIILGGDIYTKDNSDKIDYSFIIWGQEYHCLNWFYEPTSNNTRIESLKSIEKARQAILQAGEVAGKLGKPCFINLII